MALTTHSSPPTVLTAGDAYKWKQTPENIASVTGFSFRFRSVDDSDVDFSITGTDETTHFEFHITGTETAALDGGEFTVVSSITTAGGRESEYHLNLMLGDNPDSDPTKNFYLRMAALLEQHIEGRLPEGLERTEIGGVPIEKIPIGEADRLLSDYRRKGNSIEQRKKGKLNPSQKSGNKVLVRF